MDELEKIYLQRIAEIVAGSEQRIARLTVENNTLKIENVRLETENEELKNTTRDLALASFTGGSSDVRSSTGDLEQPNPDAEGGGLRSA